MTDGGRALAAENCTTEALDTGAPHVYTARYPNISLQLDNP